MPLRSLPFPFSVRFQRLFHSSAIHSHGDPKNHYEILQIPTNATPAEVKKSFYTLSKTHHPDRNPGDPAASQRFVHISEAYGILGTASKRAAYDRDNLIQSEAHQERHTPKGSYYSSGPAGGRPASGLSRRRTQFRGPPPSFYRSGGWGEHAAKRHAAQTGNGAEARNAEGGMGHRQTPFGQGEMNDVPHFDNEGHYRTHQNQDQRRQRRRSDENYIPDEATRGTLANFFLVGGIISLGVFLPNLMFENIAKRQGRDTT